MALAKTIFNYSNEDFTCNWDGIAYTIKAGDRLMVQDGIAQHIAEHLTMREINKSNNLAIINRSSDAFKKIVEKCFASSEIIEAETPEKLEMKILEKKVFCSNCDSKGVRHKKGCPTNIKKDNSDEVSPEFV